MSLDVGTVCLPFEIPQRSNFGETVVMKYQDGSVVNLTGYTAKMQIRQTPGDTNVLWTMTTENGGITITPLEGKIVLFIPAVTTATFPPSFKGFYDLLLFEDAEESVSNNRILQGPICVSPGTTVLPETP